MSPTSTAGAQQMKAAELFSLENLREIAVPLSVLAIILAAALGVVAYLLALIAYSFAPLSYSGAIREVSVVIGAVLGWIFLEEPMGGTRVLGSIVIFVGILVIALFA